MPGCEVETTRANQHRQTTPRHYDIFAGKTPLQTNPQINHHKPAIQPVAGKSRRRPALAVHDDDHKTVCAANLLKNLRAV
jgi:hypothetical protein